MAPPLFFEPTPRRFRRHSVGSFPITIAFETKEERASRRLNVALELLRSHGVEIPEELQDNSRGDISACSPNDDDEDNTKGTYENVPSENAPPAPDLHEHLNGVESSSSSGMTDWCTTRSMAANAASTKPQNHDLSTNQGTEHGMDHHGKVNTEQTWNTQYLLTTTGCTTPQAPDSTTKAQSLPSPRRPRLPDPRQINSRFRPE